MGLISGITIDNLGSIFGGIGTLIKDIRTALTGREPIDANKAAEIALKVQELEQLYLTSQNEINKIEAASPKLFVAGARPFIMWICGFAFAWQFILGPIATWVVWLTGGTTPLPQIDPSLMMQVLFALLGLGGMRTYEKYTGTEKNR